MTTTPVNSIEIPERFVRVASEWYSGVNDMLYAICSTGGLTTGSIRPSGCDTPEKWYLTLWRELAVDASFAARAAKCAYDRLTDDYCSSEWEIYDAKTARDDLRDLEDWADEVVERLEAEYGLEDWPE